MNLYLFSTFHRIGTSLAFSDIPLLLSELRDDSLVWFCFRTKFSLFSVQPLNRKSTPDMSIQRIAPVTFHGFLIGEATADPVSVQR
jgi:hypothetical protein